MAIRGGTSPRPQPVSPMLPIPPPDRLIPRFSSHGSGASSHSLLSELAESIYLFGLFGAFVIVTYAAGSYASDYSPWLALVAAAATLFILLMLLRLVGSRTSTPFLWLGLAQTAFYSALASEMRFSDANGADVSGPFWPLVVVVAAFFGWTTYMMWRRNRV